jgi:hypothetical protein
VILEGPLLDLMMDTDVLKERIINGALADVFQRAPLAAVPRRAPLETEAANDAVADTTLEAAADDAADTPH